MQTIRSEEFDVLVIQRTAVHSDFVDELIAYCKSAGVKIVYETDDDLINIDTTHKEYKNYITFLKSIKKIAKNADIITVSTENLKDIMSRYGNAVLIPNRLEESLWATKGIPIIRENKSNNILMGYIGSYTHEGDIKMLKGVVCEARKRLLSESGISLNFEIIGGQDTSEKWFQHINVPKNCIEYPLFVEYLVKATMHWDFAVAPLADTAINRSKSALKYLEYSAIKLPGIYSDIGEYSSIVKNNKTGILISNNEIDSWVSHICEMAKSMALRQMLAQNAYEDVMQNYLLEQSVSKIATILKGLS